MMPGRPRKNIPPIFVVLDRGVKNKQITVKQACEILGIGTTTYYQIRRDVLIEELKHRLEELE